MIKLLCVGKVKDRHLAALIDDYVLRINRYHKLEVREVKDEPIGSDSNAVLKKEGEALLREVKDDEYLILLDLHGEMIDSLSFAKKLDSAFISHPKLTFAIGGSLGFSSAVYQRADARLKLSDLTFLHQMTRLLILEQIYRAFKINNHETYHK